MTDKQISCSGVIRLSFAITMQPGWVFSYDVAVLADPVKLGITAGKGSYLWDGVAGTWFWIAPASDLIFGGMIQRMMPPGAPNIEDLSWTLPVRHSWIRRSSAFC